MKCSKITDGVWELYQRFKKEEGCRFHQNMAATSTPYIRPSYKITEYESKAEDQSEASRLLLIHLPLPSKKDQLNQGHKTMG